MNTSSWLTLPLTSWALYAIAGRILVYVWQKFPMEYLPTKFVKAAHACDLCSGVYIYTGLAWGLGWGIFPGVVMGIVTSCLVWVFVKGLKSLIEPQTLIIK